MVVVSPSVVLSDVTLPSVVIGSVTVMTSFLVVTSEVDTVVRTSVERVVRGRGVSGVIAVI